MNENNIEADVKRSQEDTKPQRGLRIAGTSERSPQNEEEKCSDTEHKHDPEIRERFGFDLRIRVDKIEKRWCKKISCRRQEKPCKDHRSEAGLIDHTVHL